jgi:MFS transporter, DHA2 family, multidrug resistance protein
MSIPRAAQVPDGLANPQRLLAFSTLAMAITMAVLDGNIVNVALPTMSRELAIAPENAIWIVNAFQLAVTISLLPLSALGDALATGASIGTGWPFSPSPRSPAPWPPRSPR